MTETSTLFEMENDTVVDADMLDDRSDALHPGMSAPTDIYDVARLDRRQREQRVLWLIDQADYIDGLAHREVGNKHQLVGKVIMFSGGNDSTVMAHLLRPRATHAFHANTGIGIEQTRQFVRDTCDEWELPLIEKHPPESYEELVVDQGFPGPAMHYKMFQRLKLRCEEAAHRDLVQNGRKQRVIFYGGRRRSESDRRKKLEPIDRTGARVHASPLINWTKLDMNMYRLMFDVPLNSASVLIGMSGECLCGAYAKPGELAMIRQHFPDDVAHIPALEDRVRAAGHREEVCTWGHGKGRKTKSTKTGSMCSSCSLTDTDPLWEHIDPYAPKTHVHTH